MVRRSKLAKGDGFEQRERIRKNGQHSRANGLVFEIPESWGLII